MLRVRADEPSYFSGVMQSFTRPFPKNRLRLPEKWYEKQAADRPASYPNLIREEQRDNGEPPGVIRHRHPLCGFLPVREMRSGSPAGLWKMRWGSKAGIEKVSQSTSAICLRRQIRPGALLTSRLTRYASTCTIFTGIAGC